MEYSKNIYTLVNIYQLMETIMKLGVNVERYLWQQLWQVRQYSGWLHQDRKTRSHTEYYWQLRFYRTLHPDHLLSESWSLVLWTPWTNKIVNNHHHSIFSTSVLTSILQYFSTYFSTSLTLKKLKIFILLSVKCSQYYYKFEKVSPVNTLLFSAK